MVWIAAAGPNAPELAELPPVAVSNTILSLPLRQGTTSVLNKAPPGSGPAVPGPFDVKGAAIAVPLRASGVPRGVLFALSGNPGHFDRRRARLLAAVGDIAGPMLRAA